MVTYDSNALVESLYGAYDMDEIDIRYSAHSASVGREKIIAGPGVDISCIR